MDIINVTHNDVPFVALIDGTILVLKLALYVQEVLRISLISAASYVLVASFLSTVATKTQEHGHHVYT
jgi:hypothetical protein